MEKATALILLLTLLALSMVVSADNWTLNFIERDTSPWWRGNGHVLDGSAKFSIYVGSTLVKTYSSIGSDYDYGNMTIDLSAYSVEGSTIKLAFYGSGDIIYYLYNINLKKNGQAVKFTPFTVVKTSNEQIHYDNSFREDRIVATIEDEGWINFTSATIVSAPELQINPSQLTFNKTIYSIAQGNILTITANVTNIGSATDSGVVAKLYINDVLTSTSAQQSIAAGASANFSFAYTANFAGTNRIKVTVQAVPSGTEGMIWNNNATKYILKHPYFYTTNFSNSPAVVYETQQPYSDWLSSLATAAAGDLPYNFASSSADEPTKAQYAEEMSLYGNIKGLSTYQNATMNDLLYAGKGNWCFFDRSQAGGTAEETGGTWSLYGSCDYDSSGADWGAITELYSMAYDWDAPYIISYDAEHGTNNTAIIRDNLARLCLDSYLTDKEIYAYPFVGDRNTVDNWGDWGTGKLAKEGGTGVCAMALLDYDGQYQDVDRMDEAVRFVEQDLFKNDEKMTGMPESIIQAQVTEDGIWEEGSGYQDYHEPTTSYFMALYKSTFNKSLGSIYPLAYGYATWLLRANAPTGVYPQYTVSYACPWYPLVNYYLSFDPGTPEYSLGTWFTNFAIVPDKGYKGSGSGVGCGGDYGAYPELLLGYNASAPMTTPAVPSYFFPYRTGAVLRSGYTRNDTYVFVRSSMNHTMSGHSADMTNQLTFDIWAKGAYLIPEVGNPRFLGSPEDDEAFTIGMTTMLVNCSTCTYQTNGWTAIDRDTKGTYENMQNPSTLNSNFANNQISYVAGKMTVNYYVSVTQGTGYEGALPSPYSWTRKIMMVDNGRYVISLDNLSSASARNWEMTIPLGETNPHTGEGADNYANGNLTIDRTDYNWYDRTAGTPIPFNLTSPQKIVWKTTSETNTVDTTAYPVNMTVFLNPIPQLAEFISMHMHYGGYGLQNEFHIPEAKIKQSGTAIKYLTVYFPTTTGDAQPTITNLTVTGGSGGNDYATRINYGGASDIVTFSDGETITAGDVVTNADSSFSNYNSTLQYFFLTNGSRFDYGGLNQLTATKTLMTAMMNYSGNNRSIVAVGSSGTNVTIYAGQCDSETSIYRNGTLQTKGVNWNCLNSTNLWISMTFSSPGQYDIIQGNQTTQKASNITLTSSAGWNMYEGTSTLTCTTDAVGIIPSLYVNGVGVANPYSQQWSFEFTP